MKVLIDNNNFAVPCLSDNVPGAIDVTGDINDFIKPKVDNGALIEGVTTEELKAYYLPEIEDRFTYLKTRALSSSMNKSNFDNTYLDYIREVYKDKYDVANGTITSGDVYDSVIATLQKEMADEFSEAYLDTILTSYGITPTGTHLNKMFQLVVFKYETGQAKYYPFTQFSENYRTKSILWLDNGNIDKVKQGFNMVDTLPDAMTLAEAQSKFTEFDNI